MPLVAAWHPSRGVVVTASAHGGLLVWAPVLSERWTAFAPGVEELSANRLHMEDEDEHDTVHEDMAAAVDEHHAAPSGVSPPSASSSSSSSAPLTSSSSPSVSQHPQRATTPLPPPMLPPPEAVRLGRAPPSWPLQPPPGPSATEEDLLRLSAVNPGSRASGAGAPPPPSSSWLLPPMSRTRAVPPTGPFGTVHMILRHGQPSLCIALEVDGSAGSRAAVIDPADAAVAEHAKAAATAGSSRKASPPGLSPAVEAAIGPALDAAGLVHSTASLAAGGMAAIARVTDNTSVLESSLAALTGTVGGVVAPSTTR